jgi:hypothetical protein
MPDLSRLGKDFTEELLEKVESEFKAGTKAQNYKVRIGVDKV